MVVAGPKKCSHPKSGRAASIELSASSKAESASHASSITTRVFPSLSDHLPATPSSHHLPLTFASPHTTITHHNMQCTRRLLAPPGFWKRSLQEFSRLSSIGSYPALNFCSTIVASLADMVASHSSQGRSNQPPRKPLSAHHLQSTRYPRTMQSHVRRRHGRLLKSSL